MKEGDIVKVYHDPVLCTRLEGKVKLVQKRIKEQGRQEYWTVEFLDDKFVTDRWINLDIH